MRRLLVNFARIGDLVMCTPALRRLAQDGEIHLLCRPWGRELLAEQGLLAGIHVLTHPNHGWWSELLRGKPRDEIGRTLAAIGFDEVVLFGCERGVIIQWLDEFFPGLPRRILSAPNGKYVPEAIGLALESAGFHGNYRAVPSLTVPPERLAAAQARLAPLGKRVVLIQAGTSSTHRLIRSRPNLRSLAPNQWAGMITRLLADGQADAVVLLGSPLERRDAEALARMVAAPQRAQVQVWADVPLRELMALAQASHGLISADTGPAHIAAAVGAPLLVFFGPTPPECWCPRSDGPLEMVLGTAPCGPCQGSPRMAACRANICLTKLPEAALIAGWQRLMAQPRVAP